MAVVDLLTLYQNMFGYVGLPFPLAPLSTRRRVAVPDSGEEIEVFSGTSFLQAVKIGDYEFALDALVSITGGKTVLKTQVSGLDGTVKEIISNNDYQIEIRGIIINEENDEYPEQEVASIRNMLEANVTQKIEGDIFKIFNINQMVVEKWSLPGEAGGQNYQAYQISGVSDRPVELTLMDPNNGLYVNA